MNVLKSLSLAALIFPIAVMACSFDKDAVQAVSAPRHQAQFTVFAKAAYHRAIATTANQFTHHLI